MPRSKKLIPSYQLHKATGQAFVKVPDGAGGRTFVYLGKHGTDESRVEYERVISELRVGGRKAPDAAGKPVVCVAQVLAAFIRHAEKHYRRTDGTATRELGEFKYAAGFVLRLYGDKPAREFGPLALKAIRGEFLAAGWCRKVVNQRVNRVRFVFKWAAGEELVPGAVWQGLRAVEGLQAGRSAAPERPPVAPVAGEPVAGTVPFLRPTVRAMVALQLLAGMRPGEVVRIRLADIDTSGPVWVYRPHYHKLSYKNLPRAIALGPQSQQILEKYTPADPLDFYFSPRRSVEEFHAERSASRTTPLYPSHARRIAKAKAQASRSRSKDRYTTTSYGRAIAKAVERANRPYVEAGVEIELHVPHWHPNQLRHAHATKVRKAFGLEAAQVAMGHERADITQVYAERNLDLAVRVASEIG